MSKKNKKNEKNEHYEQEVIAKHFHRYLEACCKELNAETDEDMGYFFYLTSALSISGLRDTGLCKHKTEELVSGSLRKAYEDTESCYASFH